jgi:cytochrome oxidase Cu insertion factor (SCO1/SenC/PrrC family)
LAPGPCIESLEAEAESQIFATVDRADSDRRRLSMPTTRNTKTKLLLIYFGYSYCPDVCRTDLQQIGLAVDGLSAGADAIQPLFITLDPERDTVVHLADYVPLFHPRLIGLTGSAEQILRVAVAYKVYHAKYAAHSPYYVIDHSSFIYLVDKAGQYIGFFPPGTTADRMIEIIPLNLSNTPTR